MRKVLIAALAGATFFVGAAAYAAPVHRVTDRVGAVTGVTHPAPAAVKVLASDKTGSTTGFRSPHYCEPDARCRPPRPPRSHHRRP